MVVLEKINEVVIIWWSFRVCGVLNGDEREKMMVKCCRCCCCSEDK